MVFEEQALIVTGHQNGELHVFVQPRTEVMVPPGSESTHASSLGTFRPRKITIRVGACQCMRSQCNLTSNLLHASGPHFQILKLLRP
jgi:hypothetical protein